ncbi:hypothetical protein B0H12DRAFT_1233138 [Mycena haematopus]|nr:hypothetical protein B0H12DRAFT_1233138 [Mycena haematopus]
MLLAKPTQKAPEDISTLGITTIALGMSYISTSYMPIAENQFLHASAPVRVSLALLAGLKWLTIGTENAKCCWEFYSMTIIDAPTEPDSAATRPRLNAYRFFLLISPASVALLANDFVFKLSAQTRTNTESSRQLSRAWLGDLDLCHSPPHPSDRSRPLPRACLQPARPCAAVNNQFPNIANSVASDLGYISLLLTAGRLLPKGLLLDRTMQELADECDYTREADDERFEVPWVWDGSTDRVLVDGTSIGEADISQPDQRDRNDIAAWIVELCLKELFESPPRSRTAPRAFECSLKPGYLTSEENQPELMLDTHVNSMVLLVTPFKLATPQPFAFGCGSQPATAPQVYQYRVSSAADVGSGVDQVDIESRELLVEIGALTSILGADQRRPSSEEVMVDKEDIVDSVAGSELSVRVTWL